MSVLVSQKATVTPSVDLKINGIKFTAVGFYQHGVIPLGRKKCLSVAQVHPQLERRLTSVCLDAQTLSVPDRLLLLNVKLDQGVGEEELDRGKKRW